MTNMTKVLIGLGVVGAVAAATYFVTKKADESEVHEVDEDGQVIEEVVAVEKSFIKRIKKAAAKKAIKILALVALHQQQIEAIGTIVGLGAGIFNMVNAIKEYRAGNKMREQIDELVKFNNGWVGVWNEYQHGVNHNVKWFEESVNDIYEQLENLPKKVTKKTA